MNIEQVWSELDKGNDVFWGHDGYKVYVSHVLNGSEYQLKHFSRRGTQILSVRCIANYFGSIMDESDLSKLFIK